MQPLMTAAVGTCGRLLQCVSMGGTGQISNAAASAIWGRATNWLLLIFAALKILS